MFNPHQIKNQNTQFWQEAKGRRSCRSRSGFTMQLSGVRKRHSEKVLKIIILAAEVMITLRPQLIPMCHCSLNATRWTPPPQPGTKANIQPLCTDWGAAVQATVCTVPFEHGATVQLSPASRFKLVTNFSWQLSAAAAAGCLENATFD